MAEKLEQYLQEFLISEAKAPQVGSVARRSNATYRMNDEVYMIRQ